MASFQDFLAQFNQTLSGLPNQQQGQQPRFGIPPVVNAIRNLPTVKNAIAGGQVNPSQAFREISPHTNQMFNRWNQLQQQVGQQPGQGGQPGQGIMQSLGITGLIPGQTPRGWSPVAPGPTSGAGQPVGGGTYNGTQMYTDPSGQVWLMGDDGRWIPAPAGGLGSGPGW